MKKLELNNTTLITIDTLDPTRSLFALEQCKRFVDFADVKFLTSFDSDYEHAVKIPQVVRNSTRSYSEFVYLHLNEYVDTDYVMICQWDSWIIDPRRFTKAFFDFDYVGSPCCWNGYQNPRHVTRGGNGGFSLRSKRLLEWSVGHEWIFRLFENDEIYGYEDYMYSVMLIDVLRNEGFSVSDREISARWGVQGGATHMVEDANGLACFGQHQWKSRLPLFPAFFEEVDGVEIDCVLYDGRCVTDIFLYHLPVWLRLGKMPVRRELFDMIFATDGNGEHADKWVPEEQQGLKIKCSQGTFRLGESDVFDPMKLYRTK